MLSYKRLSEVPEGTSAFIYKKGRRRIVINIDRANGIVVARLPIGVNASTGEIFGIPSIANELTALNGSPFDYLKNQYRVYFTALKNLKGIAKCNSKVDKFNFERGVKLACKRLENGLNGVLKSIVLDEINKTWNKCLGFMDKKQLQAFKRKYARTKKVAKKEVKEIEKEQEKTAPVAPENVNETGDAAALVAAC